MQRVQTRARRWRPAKKEDGALTTGQAATSGMSTSSDGINWSLTPDDAVWPSETEIWIVRCFLRSTVAIRRRPSSAEWCTVKTQLCPKNQNCICNDHSFVRRDCAAFSRRSRDQVRLPRLCVAALASRDFFSLLNAHNVHTSSHEHVDALPACY